MELNALRSITAQIRPPATDRGKAGGHVVAFDSILNKLREMTNNTVEQGRAFEDLCEFYFARDPLHTSGFAKVQRYADWARERGLLGQDTGVDLVATLLNAPAGEPQFCAIQCKFFMEGTPINRKGIDSFLVKSSTADFARRIIVDTTGQPFGKNMLETLERQEKPVQRIGLNHLRNSRIDWEAFLKIGAIRNRPAKKPLPHQKDAIKDVLAGFEKADRGKMLMACATGKTYTALKIAERRAGYGGRVLFLAPSLALVSQAIRDWCNDASQPLLCYAVCSDSTVGKTEAEKEDGWFSPSDLEIPASTSARALANAIAAGKKQHRENMVVVFATYHSVQRVIDAQHKHGLGEFDLVVCDEAHRTTGLVEESKEQSEFVKVHNAKQLRAKKRLYMTATPRIYSEGVKSKAKEKRAELWSMDDPALYGEVFYEISFAKAVTANLLTDYKVIILDINKEEMSRALGSYIQNNDVQLDDAALMLGCYRAIAKMDIEGANSPAMGGKQKTPPVNTGIRGALWRSLAYCRSIKDSKEISRLFGEVATEAKKLKRFAGKNLPDVVAQHIDGTDGAATRDRVLSWLASADEEENACRVLCNVRCLSEGVDVPTLDAVFFMHPRKSKVDVVQSVGRVMRKAQGKKLGYIILPVVVQGGESVDETLEKAQYKIVWQVLNALRAHDKSLDGEINAAGMGEGIRSHRRYLDDEGIEVTHVGKHIEIVSVVKKMPHQAAKRAKGADVGKGNGKGEGAETPPVKEPPKTGQLFPHHEAIISKFVERCGTRAYWPEWAADIARIAQNHILRINEALKIPQTRAVFDRFLAEVRSDINEAVTEEEAVEMLAQHLVTKPVFDALFKTTTQTTEFARSNPVSQAMDKVMAKLQETNIGKETENLQQFYDDIALRVQSIESAAAKQKLVKELYDNFFRQAFPRMTERLGIVYTPVEVVDFIVHSVNDVLKQDFNQTLGAKNVSILDPFTGTGTFIVRLLESKLISPEELKQKYTDKIHANEILLLAYYVAAVNIEQAYQGATGEYKPFPGICLTDTFQLHEGKGSIAGVLEDNSRRRIKQRDLPIRVIFGNPPYSVGQRSGNDNAQNVKYPKLDKAVADTYVRRSKASGKTSLYDSYIRAIRWASDRIEDNGVVAFVTNAGWLSSVSADGMRKCLSEEYSSLYIFNLRGNARLQGELWRKEGGKIFGGGSRAPVAINIFVKNPAAKEHGKIYYHDIGDYLSREDKLTKIATYKNIAGIKKNAGWQKIKPDANHDWFNQREASFDDFASITNKHGKGIFPISSMGLKTNRDTWAYNFSKDALTRNMERMIDFYNAEAKRYIVACKNSKTAPKVNDFVDNNRRKISWSGGLRNNLVRAANSGELAKFDKTSLRVGIYRPFTKQCIYFNRKFNESVLRLPSFFPNASVTNRLICISSNGAKTFSALATDNLPDIHLLESSAVCFPLRIYEPQDGRKNLLNTNAQDCAVRDGVTDWALAAVRKIAGNKTSKEDIFYYVYGVLHAPDYREKYANNLTKELPRIPLPKSAAQFSAFAKAGRALADLHIGYETAKEYPLKIIKAPNANYRAQKMRWLNKQKTELQYNDGIRITNIPPQALQYVVNGRSPVEWVAERQGVSVHKESGIQNDANHYAATTADGEKYPLKLIARAITVAIETQKIIAALPPLLK